MSVGVIAFSRRGEALGRRLGDWLETEGEAVEVLRCPTGGLGAWTADHFPRDRALVFIGSCGVAVRAVAPFVQSKTTDPAVVVMDEGGTFAVSLLSGHLGGGNELAVRLARWAEAIPVVTTATDVNQVFAVDDWARRQGLTVVNPQRIKWVSARLLAGETVRLKSAFPVDGPLPSGVEPAEEDYDILVTHRSRGRAEALRLVAPVAVLGVGCRKGVSAEKLEEAYQQILRRAGCHPAAVGQVCSIHMKAREPGLVEFCRVKGLPLRTFSAGELAAVPGEFSGSAFVREVTGVDNVCERSAVLGCGEGGRLLTGKDAGAGITMALAVRPYTISFETQEARER